MVTMAMYRSDQTRADAPAIPGLQSHPLPPQQHGPSSSSLQPQPVSLSSASARPLSSTSSQRLPPLAMSIGTAPVPGAHLRGPPALGQQQSTRTLQGPSAQDWARHRDIIVDLYRQFPLKKLNQQPTASSDVSMSFPRLNIDGHNMPADTAFAPSETHSPIPSLPSPIKSQSHGS
ncbi:hypothetical protein B0H65DRAFT_179502 [Neurospora tetraspora]|uniref:Uncharacterized protein n=1 Tax=Neurospora tetraspora TaxID=94610 RepID=A0AAE0JEK9_9PEZI|nr:hypothetical protein B0H65DRAFT_179502 [Neurospora tetraspora]